MVNQFFDSIMDIDQTIIILFSVATVIRMATLLISIANEKKLKQQGAVEYGKKNSKVLVLCHALFYVSCLLEAVLLKKQFNDISLFGIGVFIFSMIMLWIVIVSLKGMWTLKLIITPSQKIIKTFMFRFFRHPNYFLNIIPELVSIALICQAWLTLLIGLPIYCIPLGIRIAQEEKVMKTHWSDY